MSNKSFHIEFLLIQQVPVNTHTWIHQGHHRNIWPLAAEFYHSSDSNTRKQVCCPECLWMMNWCFVFASDRGSYCVDTTTDVWLNLWASGITELSSFAHNCWAKRHTGSFLPLDHSPDVIDYQPRFVPADHLILLLGVAPQLNRTNNRPQDTQYQGGNHEEGNKPELYLYRRHLLLEFRGTDITSWTKEDIRVCINITNILGDPICQLCIYVIAADKVTVRPNASWEDIWYCTLIPMLKDKTTKHLDASCTPATDNKVSRANEGEVSSFHHYRKKHKNGILEASWK